MSLAICVVKFCMNVLPKAAIKIRANNCTPMLTTVLKYPIENSLVHLEPPKPK